MSQDPRTLSTFLKKMPLADYITYFGSVFDKKTRKTSRFELWPKQRRCCELMEDSQECTIPKARQLGVSEITAEELVKEALQSKGAVCLVFSKTERDAIEYLETKIRPKLMALPKIKGLVWPHIVNDTQKYIKLSNGSRLICLPASNRAGASMVADYVVFDEAGGIDLQHGVSLDIMYRNVSPTLEKSGGKMRIIGTSEPGSYYNEMIRDIINGEKPIDCFFLPADADPNRTPEWFAGVRAKFPSDADFKSQYPFTIADFFATREGLIYPQFDSDIGGAHIQEFTPMSNHVLYLGYDHGYRHAAVLLECYHDTKSGTLYVRREHYWYETHAENIADDIKEDINQIGRRPNMMIADAAIFSETGSKGVIEIFKERGIHEFQRSFKPRARIGLDAASAAISLRLTDKTIVIHPECAGLIQELMTWHWDPNTKGEKPIDAKNDAIDVLRYICAELDSKRSQPKLPPPVKGYRTKLAKASGGKRMGAWQTV